HLIDGGDAASQGWPALCDDAPPRAGRFLWVTLSRMRTMQISVLGAGAWGTALAIQAARAGHAVCLWGRNAAAMDAMRAGRRNSTYL
ncbi:hypothetical protein Q6294_31390, partial [Klebsiella pneumoniae]|nr:hypothetical protein [Klebsiella pneumoniae]